MHEDLSVEAGEQPRQQPCLISWSVRLGNPRTRLALKNFFLLVQASTCISM